MCRHVCNESSSGSEECCCIGTLSAEDEIRMLEARKTLEKIRLDGMDRRLEELRNNGDSGGTGFP